MGNNLKIMGNTFSNVSSITAHDATSGTHKYVDTSDTTAVAGDIKKNKTFYGADGIKIQGTLEVYAGAHHSVIATISFTIGGTSYQAQDGMMWGEWVSSDYNTGGFYTDGSYVLVNASNYVSGSNLTRVINADYAYTISNYGGGI